MTDPTTQVAAIIRILDGVGDACQTRQLQTAIRQSRGRLATGLQCEREARA